MTNFTQAASALIDDVAALRQVPTDVPPSMADQIAALFPGLSQDDRAKLAVMLYSATHRTENRRSSK